MAAGADSIDDMDLLRHGAMGEVFGGIRAPSTLGSFLRSFTWGNAQQLEKASREVLAALTRLAPLLPGRDVVAFAGIDSTQKRVYGHRKQGAAFGHAKVQGKSLLLRGLSALAATVSTPLGSPVIAAARLRGGNAASARGAARFAAETVRAARAAGCAGTLIVRADPAFCSAPVRNAVRELYGREPRPGYDYAQTEVVHCGSRSEHGVAAAAPTCAARYLPRIISASPSRVIVLVGRTALHHFSAQTGITLTERIWGPHDLAGRDRCVVSLPHPNARGQKEGVADNIGRQHTQTLQEKLTATSP
jgi:hypothetical protein